VPQPGRPGPEHLRSERLICLSGRAPGPGCPSVQLRERPNLLELERWSARVAARRCRASSRSARLHRAADSAAAGRRARGAQSRLGALLRRCRVHGGVGRRGPRGSPSRPKIRVLAAAVPRGETLPMEYVPPEAFGEDYLYFYDAFLTGEVSDAQADRLWRLLGLESGVEVLDVPCGHGRIANRLAARGASVTGLDANALFLARARRRGGARRRGRVHPRRHEHVAVGGELRPCAQLVQLVRLLRRSGPETSTRGLRTPREVQRAGRNCDRKRRVAFGGSDRTLERSFRSTATASICSPGGPKRIASSSATAASASSVSRFAPSPSPSCGSGCSMQASHRLMSAGRRVRRSTCRSGEWSSSSSPRARSPQASPGTQD
jgi:Methyltransferase domain